MSVSPPSNTTIYYDKLKMSANTPQYHDQKGFCEDLDEGKFSLPLLRLLSTRPNNIQLQSILMQRRCQGKLTLEMKKYILEQMKNEGCLDYTRDVLKRLDDEVERVTKQIGDEMGTTNWIMLLVLERLRL